MEIIKRIFETLRLMLAIFGVLSSIIVLVLFSFNSILSNYGIIEHPMISDKFCLFIIILSCISNIYFECRYLKNEEVAEYDEDNIKVK